MLQQRPLTNAITHGILFPLSSVLQYHNCSDNYKKIAFPFLL